MTAAGDTGGYTGGFGSCEPIVGVFSTGGRSEAVELATRAAALLQKITQHAEEEVRTTLQPRRSVVALNST